MKKWYAERGHKKAEAQECLKIAVIEEGEQATLIDELYKGEDF